MVYTLTSLITLLETGLDRFHCSYVEWETDRRCFYATLQCSGVSVDTRTSYGWEEIEMRYELCSPFMPEDDLDFSDDGGVPLRTHGYKRCYMRLCVTPPANRKRGDTYTEAEVADMVEVISHGDDVPGMGFTYYNCSGDEEA